MKQKIDWLNHALEFLVVLIGILIAFQLNQCSNNRTKNKLIENHLTQIKLECQKNKEKLQVSVEKITSQIAICDALLSEIAVAKNPEKIRNYATQLLDLRNVDVSQNAYQVLVQSGDIRFINDYDEKRMIISLYDDFEKVAQINQSNLNLYDNHFYPYIKSNFDLVNWDKVTTSSIEEEKLYYAKEFANTISTYRFLLIAKKRIYLKQKKVIESYLKK